MQIGLSTYAQANPINGLFDGELAGGSIADSMMTFRRTMDKEKIKQWAIVLERELKKQKDRSKDVAELCEYRSLMTAISRAKMERVVAPVHLRLLPHFYFETGIKNYKNLIHALNCFSLLLEGYELPSEH